MASNDKANMFRGQKNVSVTPTSTSANNQQQSNVCNRFFLFGFLALNF
jgi:hypothetical protein